MPWSGTRHTGRLRLPEPASVRTTRVTVAVLASWDRGQENPAVARCELPRQAYTSQPDFNRVGREQAERACPRMTEQGERASENPYILASLLSMRRLRATYIQAHLGNASFTR